MDGPAWCLARQANRAAASRPPVALDSLLNLMSECFAYIFWNSFSAFYCLATSCALYCMYPAWKLCCSAVSLAETAAADSGSYQLCVWHCDMEFLNHRLDWGKPVEFFIIWESCPAWCRARPWTAWSAVGWLVKTETAWVLTCIIRHCNQRSNIPASLVACSSVRAWREVGHPKTTLNRQHPF